MLPLPPEVSARFDETLARHAIPVYQQPHYRKWLRVYLADLPDGAPADSRITC